MKRNKILTTFVMAILLFSIGAIFLPGNSKVEEIGAPQLSSWPTAPPTGAVINTTITTTAFMSVSPNPIGVGQSALINLWLEPPVQYNRYFSGYTIKIGRAHV